MQRNPGNLNVLFGKIFVFAFTWSFGGGFKRQDDMEDDIGKGFVKDYPLECMRTCESISMYAYMTKYLEEVSRDRVLLKMISVKIMVLSILVYDFEFCFIMPHLKLC